MFKIIGGDGREYGPVTADTIASWIAQNRANGRTQVKPEGATDWLPLAQLPEFAEVLATRQPPPPPLPPAVDTGGAEPRPAEDPAIGPPGGSPTWTEQARRLSVFDTLSRGWEIVNSRFWLTVGGTTLVILVNQLCSALPVVNFVAALLLTEVFAGGILWTMLRVSRGEEAEFADIFGGFSRAFGSLAWLTLIMAVAGGLLLGFAAAPLLFTLYKAGGAAQIQAVFSALNEGDPQAFASLDASQLIGPLMLFPVLSLPFVYVTIAWLFAPILIVDRGLGVWEALTLSRRAANRCWFRLFLLHLAFIPLCIAGLLCLLVGVLVVMAVYHAAVAAAYQTAFGETAPAADQGPAQPR